MSFKLQAAMPRELHSGEIKPRRFDLTMSRRTRRPPAATPTTSCREQDHYHQAVDVEGLGLFQPVVEQPERQDPDGLFCLSDHLQSRQPELMDAHYQEHETSEQQRSEHATKEKDDESEAQQQKEEDEDEEECQDNSRRFSLQELIEDEVVDDDGVKGAATGGMEDNAPAPAAAAAAAAGGGVGEVSEGAAAAAAGAEKRPAGQQVAGRRVIGIMRRYVKVRSIKPKRASPEKNVAPVC